MRKWIGSLLLVLLAAGCEEEGSWINYVDPFIGTAGHGHTYPGPSWPFGMVQLSPDTRLDGWDGCSGYHYSDSVIYGFSHTHLSGTGASDYADVLLMPTTGEVNLLAIDPDDPEEGYASRFSHKKERAEPGFYQVFLEDDGILADLTVSQRVGFHRYTFPKSEQSNIILDLEHRDEVLSSYVKVVSEYEIEGLRRSRSWAKDQYVYFVIRFSKPFKDYGLYIDGQRITGSEASGRKVKANFSFSTRRKEQIQVKVAISAVGVDGARKNLEAEIPHWNFDRALKNVQHAWNDVLNRFQAVSSSHSKLRTFYTAVYHQYLNPNMYMDVDSLYRGRDMLVHKATGHDYYTLFSLWDTYRATHPLFTIMEQEKTNHFIQTFLRQYEQAGLLPVWELSANETGTMIGYHAVSVIADAYMKGIRSFDATLALQAARASAMQDPFGLRQYRQFGYIPSGQERESVSKTLEYAYDDWCIAQLADSLNEPKLAAEYRKRSKNYMNLFDPGTGFFRAKTDALWVAPFDPREVSFHYTEANAWQYLFSVQHDVHGLVSLLGGTERFTMKLDSLFEQPSFTTGKVLPDITGLIGQYAHGNEPSHHVAYLYNYAGKPWKTQEKVSYICQTFYSDQPDGLCGNEDCGQMSAWYLFSAMGFYPVTPGSDQYVLGSPQLEQLTLKMEDGHEFQMLAHGLDDAHIYVDRVMLNGEEWPLQYIRHADILRGGKLEFFMTDKPNTHRGTDPATWPGKPVDGGTFIPVPFAVSGKQSFEERTEVQLACVDTLAEIRYQSVSHASPGTSYFRTYEKPIVVNSSSKLRFFSQRDTLESPVNEAYFYELSTNRKVIEISRYSEQYRAGGDQALVNGMRGARNFATGRWQGFEGADLVAVIDLGFNQTVNRLALSCLQDQGGWIFMPMEVIYETSTDGIQFEEAARIQNDLEASAEGTYMKEFTASIWKTARYIRVSAINRGVCPDWHPGSGGKAWIFADELIIE